MRWSVPFRLTPSCASIHAEEGTCAWRKRHNMRASLRPIRRGHVRVEETLDMPWPNDDGATPVYAGHEFHHAKLVNFSGEMKTAYKVLRGNGIGGGKVGMTGSLPP